MSLLTGPRLRSPPAGSIYRDPPTEESTQARRNPGPCALRSLNGCTSLLDTATFGHRVGGFFDRLTITSPQGPIKLVNKYPLFESPTNDAKTKIERQPASEPEREQDKKAKHEPEKTLAEQPGEPVSAPVPVRRSRRLAKLEPPSLEHSNNPFWVHEMALERMEQVLGMSVHGSKEMETGESVPIAQVHQEVEREPEESDDKFFGKDVAARKHLEGGENATRDIADGHNAGCLSRPFVEDHSTSAPSTRTRQGSRQHPHTQ
ncbi:hypothetical protein RhiLY_00025 [Ceratobasidium sp. AG-Ba]|nr:hypothetical protein RhiLY_00025 [Ceratobasidium sp. AG-Ba]